ncbi:hypothetical protein EVAR_42854_1 [Eumeta japonica]|uniref:Uncharacterized protein n=1 Tax=Eumeta variegata TaxID=151549 RepID=A0A4C1WGG7_EUMVA|nr:hypothetical protein EVAR_42854_1 [Eumeta japonica]
MKFCLCITDASPLRLGIIISIFAYLFIRITRNTGPSTAPAPADPRNSFESQKRPRNIFIEGPICLQMDGKCTGPNSIRGVVCEMYSIDPPDRRLRAPLAPRAPPDALSKDATVLLILRKG